MAYQVSPPRGRYCLVTKRALRDKTCVTNLGCTLYSHNTGANTKSVKSARNGLGL